MQHFLIYACNAAESESQDPISNTVVAIMSSPVAIAFSNVGVRAFKNTSIATLPYQVLSAEQADLVRDLLQEINNGLAVSNSSDANGGFLLRMPTPPSNMFVDRGEVMQKLRASIMSANGYGSEEVKERVYAILAQRINACTTLAPSKRAS
jgi:hypothetical protein